MLLRKDFAEGPVKALGKDFAEGSAEAPIPEENCSAEASTAANATSILLGTKK